LAFLEGLLSLIRKRFLAYKIFLFLLILVVPTSIGLIADAAMNFNTWELDILAFLALSNLAFYILRIPKLYEFREKMHVYYELEQNYLKAYESEE
jgi:hypothetical protein